ncbi:cytosolic nonspecific dipeptidase [Weissella oryzae SG25]|uniref:Cytosolic nonspecific dipeptidase n=1 Tax=Weissella oryzae (strain DSM 25784 / JCM 18191 / LMG 30913 / SG25) TaxID=1329250 RepID=A0A069CUP8_WEIOS|nr:hypothetical protein [Weissella oryzae]GAK31530.1 cytosolic nonspecific dipeptidase [Weissella oryzae SG25]
MKRYNLINRQKTFRTLAEFHPKQELKETYIYKEFTEHFKIGNLAFGTLPENDFTEDLRTLMEWNEWDKQRVDTSNEWHEQPIVMSEQQDQIYISMMFKNLVEKGTYSYWQVMRAGNNIELFQLVTTKEIDESRYIKNGPYAFQPLN